MGERTLEETSRTYRPVTLLSVMRRSYTPTEHMALIFSGVDKNRPDSDNLNFYTSQCRIRIEMTFGLMTMKWGILQRLLMTKLTNDKWLILCIARLYNFVINEWLSSG
jgi:hypothetical protein